MRTAGTDQFVGSYDNASCLRTWNTVLLENFTVPRPVKKFLEFYATQRFFTELTRGRHLPASQARSNRSMFPLPISWRSIVILRSHLCLGLPSVPFPQQSPPKPCIYLSSPPPGTCGSEYLSRYSDWLRAGRSGDQTLVGVRYSAHVQTGPGAHPTSYTMGTGYLSRG
jgi:hypothetical protein